MDMSIGKLLLLAFYGMVAFVCAMNIFGGGSEKSYERIRSIPLAWFWLHVFGVPVTKENCIRFLNMLSWVGMIVSMLGVVAVILVYGER